MILGPEGQPHISRLVSRGTEGKNRSLILSSSPARIDPAAHSQLFSQRNARVFVRNVPSAQLSNRLRLDCVLARTIILPLSAETKSRWATMDCDGDVHAAPTRVTLASDIVFPIRVGRCEVCRRSVHLKWNRPLGAGRVRRTFHAKCGHRDA